MLLLSFFSNSYEIRVYIFLLPRAVLARVLKGFFFSASKLMLDCCLRVVTLYMLLNGKHLIINLV